MPLQRSVSATGSLAALNLFVQAARDLPGRKTVIFASEGFQLWEETVATKTSDEDTRVRFAVDRVIDQATRSGVVIYAIEGQALQPAGLRAADDIHSANPRGNPDAMGEALRGLAGDRQRAVRDSQESLAYLAEQTGGFAVLNTNDLGSGLRRIGNDVRDYYVIGYEPDRDMFAAKGKSPRLHKITVNVRRAGVRVRTRKEFIGVSDPERPSGPPTPANNSCARRFRRSAPPRSPYAERTCSDTHRHVECSFARCCTSTRKRSRSPLMRMEPRWLPPISSAWSSTATARKSTPSPRDSTSDFRTLRPSRRLRAASCTPRSCQSASPAAISCVMPFATVVPARSARSAAS